MSARSPIPAVEIQPMHQPMHMPILNRAVPATARLQREAVQFRLILAAIYPLFLAAAVLQRLRPEPARRAPAQPRRTVFGEARAMAAQAVPFAFMG